jgi:diguanylate cyclase (GGDEF)-like protein
MMQTHAMPNPLRILLIEDSKGDALLIEKSLKGVTCDAFPVSVATTLELGLRLLSGNKYDVALLDRSLPDTTGFSGLFALQHIAPHLPVVFLTAYKDEEVALEAIEQGAQDYLFKDKIDGMAIRRSIQFAVIRKHFETLLLQQANYDSLTGLGNRILFENRLDMALARVRRHGGGVALLYLDLDAFKPVNDTYGHAAGDALLKEVGVRIRSTLRACDTAARLGGDEFAILLEGINNPSYAELVARKLIEACGRPFAVAEHSLTIGLSIGIVCCTHLNLLPRDILMDRADKAMYEAKTSSGGNIWHHYAEAPNELVHAYSA